MKKLITSLVIISVGLFNTATAQLKLGLKFSPQLTWVGEQSKSISTSGVKLNASYGLMIDKYFTDNYAIATEIAVTSMTANVSPTGVAMRSDQTGLVSDPDYTYKVQYIAVPLMLRMRTKEIGYFRYYAEFGMNFGFQFRSKADIGKGSNRIKNVDVNNPDDEYFTTNISNGSSYNDNTQFIRVALLVGAGVQYNLFGNTLLVAGARYENAFTDLLSNDDRKANLNMGGLHIGVLF